MTLCDGVYRTVRSYLLVSSSATASRAVARAVRRAVLCQYPIGPGVSCGVSGVGRRARRVGSGSLGGPWERSGRALYHAHLQPRRARQRAGGRAARAGARPRGPPSAATRAWCMGGAMDRICVKNVYNLFASCECTSKAAVDSGALLVARLRLFSISFRMR